MPPSDDTLRIATWNLFHLQDEGGGPIGFGTVVRRRHRERDGLVHLNRKHLDPAADVLRRIGADLVLLQEVPPRAVPRLGRRLGMHGDWNPDLVRTHEGNANAVLVGPRLVRVPGSVRRLRLNPWRQVLGAWRAHGTDLRWREMLRWLGEPRVAVAGQVRRPGGPPVTVVSLHLHNARGETERAHEVGRLIEALRNVPGPLIVGGDFNLMPSSPHMARLAELGLVDEHGDRRMNIDRVFTRGVEVVEPARRLEPSVREFAWTGRRGHGRVRVSDHDPVVVTVRLPA
jgi:endonuclease/exonuclease/phosphatase family metal-dependent hydrolase